MQYEIPGALVDQGFFGRFWDGFGIMIHGFPPGSVDMSSRIFWATVEAQNQTSDKSGSALFSGIEAPVKYPESSIDLYANFYDGSYRPLTPLFFVARLSLVPNQLTNQYIIFKNMDFVGSVFAQDPNVTGRLNATDLLSGNATLSSPVATIAKVERVNSVELVVTVDSSAPFALVVTEPYDRLWRAYLSGSELRPSSVYGLANAFVISQTGTLTIRIYYTLQTYLNLGIQLSVAALGGTTVAAVVSYRRRKTKPVQLTRPISLVAVPAEDFDVAEHLGYASHPLDHRLSDKHGGSFGR